MLIALEQLPIIVYRWSVGISSTAPRKDPPSFMLLFLTQHVFAESGSSKINGVPIGE